jgi:hypothetical protein
LPAPGGPVTSVTGPAAPPAIRLVRRGREIAHPGSAGTVILDQAALAGLVQRIADLRLELILVRLVTGQLESKVGDQAV